jgi:hypothetical protein
MTVRMPWLFALILSLALSGTGCALLPEPRQDIAPAPSVLEYCDWLRGATPEELAEEQRRLEADQAQAPVIRSVSLALLLSFHPGPDDARALELLGTVEVNGGDPADPVVRQYRQFGVLWRGVLEDRARRERETGDFARVLGEQRRRARDLQEKNSALQQQIEALKSIEQQMNRREPPRAGNP